VDHVADDHTEGALFVDVVVPTYRRPELLDRCLRALAARHRLPNRVLVVAVRRRRRTRGDQEHLTSLSGLEQITVRAPGVLAAMAAGVARSTGDILAFTDDDAAPRPDWIESSPSPRGSLSRKSPHRVFAMGGFLLAMQSGAVRAHNLLIRVALVHDYLTQRGGAERVGLASIFDEARFVEALRATTFAAATGSGPRELTGSAR